MKKVISIALGGIVFAIEEDAHDRLKAYLETIDTAFSGNDDYKEIKEDIESAIAEKFLRAKKSEKRAVTTEDVERVVEEMGDVGDYTEEAEMNEEPAKDDVHTKRRLYRNSDDAILGGVASGIAAYFDIDPVIVRILFVLSIFLNGLGIVLYIILWIIVPAAETTAEKYAMRGERMTISHITERVKKKIDTIDTENIETAKGIWVNLRNGLQRVFEFMGKIIKFALHVLRYFFGIAFIVFGALAIALVISGTVLVTTGKTLFTFDPLAQSLVDTLFSHSPEGLVFLLSIALIAIIPILFLIIAGVSLMRLKNMFTVGSAVSLFIVWVVALIVGSAMSAGYASDFIERQKNTNNVACTLDAKICPDGTAVGRVGPDCEFAACPMTETPPEVPGDIQAMIDAKADLIVVEEPAPLETISSPLTVRGEARGNWYFEASFPIVIVDWDGRIIGEGFATAQEEWMTTDFVPFEGTITFDVPTDTPYRRGAIIFRKDNPSGLPEHDDALEISVTF